MFQQELEMFFGTLNEEKNEINTLLVFHIIQGKFSLKSKTTFSSLK